VIPPSYDHVNGPREATISHAYSGPAVTQSEARATASGLLDAAERAEKLNAAVLLLLDQVHEVVQSLRTDLS